MLVAVIVLCGLVVRWAPWLTQGSSAGRPAAAVRATSQPASEKPGAPPDPETGVTATPEQDSQPAKPVKPVETSQTEDPGAGADPQTQAAPKIPATGPGKFHRAKVTASPAKKRGQRVRYDVQVEKNLPYGAAQIAAEIHATLNDSRSWSGSGDWSFELVDGGSKADFHLYLATPKTTDRLCAPLRTRGRVSCQMGNKVVLNARRWANGALVDTSKAGGGKKPFGDDLVGYRQYLVNHEVGHRLGKHHVQCNGKGKRASVMVQQTKGLDGCRANPWPSPKRR